MRKRGQVTVFIIVGMLIVAAAAGIYFLSNSFAKKDIEITTGVDTAGVSLFIEGCLKRTLEAGVLFVADKGGYYTLPELSSTEAVRNAPYYYYQGEPNMPSLELIEREVSKYVEENLPFCLENFQTFSFPIMFDKIIPTTKINLENVETKIKFPVTIQQGDKQVTLNVFTSTINSPFGKAYEASKEVLNYAFIFENAVCLDCLDETGEKNGFTIRALELDVDEIFYVIEEPDNPLFMYRFATKYKDLPEEEIIDYSQIFGEIAPWAEIE